MFLERWLKKKTEALEEAERKVADFATKWIQMAGREAPVDEAPGDEAPGDEAPVAGRILPCKKRAGDQKTEEALVASKNALPRPKRARITLE